MIPAPKAVPFRFDEALLPINKMDAWGQRTFHAYKSLNRLQSIVFPVAYGTNENMLVCAPTGAVSSGVLETSTSMLIIHRRHRVKRTLRCCLFSAVSPLSPRHRSSAMPNRHFHHQAPTRSSMSPH